MTVTTLQVLDRYRQLLTEKGSQSATLLDTKGPEIRTAMLRGGENIKLEKGQEVIIEAVGDRYTVFEGYKDATETRIGLSYEALCQSVKPGNKLLLSDGVISIEVLEILNDHELRGRVLNSKSLGQRKNCNLPGVKVCPFLDLQVSAINLEVFMSGEASFYFHGICCGTALSW